MTPELEIKVFDMDDVLRTPELSQTVRLLTINRYSGMNTALDAFEIEMHNRKINAKAIIAYRDGVAVGWALYSKDLATDTYRFNPSGDEICFQIYVARPSRRQGIGSKLLLKATEIAGADVIKVYESDAPEFFGLHQCNGKNIASIYDN